MTNSIIDVTKVRTVDGSREANELLSEGWVLLNTAPGKDEQGFPLTYFMLGLPRAPKLDA